MILHNFKYSLKTLLKSRLLLFWTFAFPILLGIFFHMAFQNIEQEEKLNVIKVAVVAQENSRSDFFLTALEKLSNGENKIFDLSYTSKKEAEKLLEEKEITGYLTLEKEVSITVNSSGINETVLRTVVDEIQRKEQRINLLFQKEIEKGSIEEIDVQQIQKEVFSNLDKVSFKIKDGSSQHLSYTMIEYYTLLAMACLYGGLLAMVTVNKKLANMDPVGKRTAISPMKKSSMLLGSLLASYLVQLFGVALLFLFTIFVLKVDYGKHLFYTVLLSATGSLAGLSLGIFIASVFKTNENAKTGILISFTMAGCFFSGMMGVTMKYIIDKNIPILNKINPASMLTDGFYALYYYDTLDRYFLNVISLLLFSILLLALSSIFLRRQKYDSI